MSDQPTKASLLKRVAARLGRFFAAQWSKERTSLRVDWAFLALTGFVGLLLFIIPTPAYDPFEVAVPADGTPVRTALPLEEGRLYKVTVSGTYRYRYGSLADAQFRSAGEDDFGELRPSLLLNGSLVQARQRDLERHRYTFYIAGEGEPLEAAIYDTWERGFGEDSIPYWDNDGRLVLNVREADFRCYPKPSRRTAAPGYLLHYDLDPVPAAADAVTLRIWRLPVGEEEEPELVFLADTTEPVGDYGDRRRLSRNAVNDFRWNGRGNLGAYRDRPVPFGSYAVEVRVQSEGRSYSTLDWEGDYPRLAVLPGAAEANGPFALRHPVDAEKRPLYGYKPPRALTPVLGPAELELLRSDFPCLAQRPGLTDAPEYHSDVLAHLKRRLNLALTTAAELEGIVFEPCRDTDGQFDDELVRLLGAFHERFPHPTPTAEEFLRKHGNLGGMLGEGPPPPELLARVVGPETFQALTELRFSLPGLPGEWGLDDFDNLPCYDAEHPQRSLYHRFAELAARYNAARPDGADHPGFLDEAQRELLLNPHTRYDIADGAFRAFCQAVSYQECGLMHVLGSGRSYRAAYGHGSATGYMQLTGDPVRHGGYQLEYERDGETQRVGFPSLPLETRYDLRYINELNLQVGIQYLKLVLVSQSRWDFEPRFQAAYRPGGALDFTTRWGTLLRLKLAGAMYNAGPYGIKVILRDIYSTIPPPPDGVGEAAWYREQLAALPEREPVAQPEDGRPLMETPEGFPFAAPPAYKMDYPGLPGVDYFFGPCGGDIEPFLTRLALDLRRFLAGEYSFPCQSYPGGEARLYEIFKMLGPFWISRGAGGDWARAALMKLEREVIGYTVGMGRNVGLFWNRGEEIFRERNFGLLASTGKTRVELTGGDEAPSLDEEAPPADESPVPAGAGVPEAFTLPEELRVEAPGDEPTGGEGDEPAGD